MVMYKQTNYDTSYSVLLMHKIILENNIFTFNGLFDGA